MPNSVQNEMNREYEYGLCLKKGLLLALLPIVSKMQLYHAFANSIHLLTDQKFLYDRLQCNAILLT